jgi:peroxiredoxin
MVLTPSKMLSLNTLAPDFRLPDTEGSLVGLSDFSGSRAYLVIFMCNHCPYVKHLRQSLAALTSEYLKRGVAVFGINSNDVQNYPVDRPELMKREKAEQGYEFPYLFDETQEVAKAYQAACTPDFYLFDGDKKLVYRGQFDDSRPGSGVPPTGKDLREALECVIAGRECAAVQRPSIGCNIKWK